MDDRKSGEEKTGMVYKMVVERRKIDTGRGCSTTNNGVLGPLICDSIKDSEDECYD